MKILLFALQSLSAGAVFAIGKILTLPFGSLNKWWLRLTVPAMISFLEQNLALIDPEDNAEKQAYELTEHAISLYRKELQRVEAND